ncbi:hypothetical protein EF888_09890 [Silicimonas algicola]|uniref:Glucose uptake protein n=1 Tax=Silicimonas algicola TaxID=1826607 RepID=A0A316GQ57_9RHOB|nr:hypothetical protein [Silicimonas algicola]AZQ67413.1 hypothetical protein EF888_09890 [Silicimonas algicola]PWK57097.1 hypothetical protein C8D95_103335 [Silicimonas algicola]
MTRVGVLWLGAAVTVFLLASVALRRHVDQPSTAGLLLALALYTLGNLMMVRLMRESGMAVAISVSAVAQLVLANVVALALFGERPGPMQSAGILLGVVAVGLILFPAGRAP